MADCEDPVHLEATRCGLFVYAALDEDDDLIYVSFTRKNPKSFEQTAFFPLLPPAHLAERIYATLQRRDELWPETDPSDPSGQETLLKFYSRPPAIYTLSRSGVIEYNGSAGSQTRILSCVSRAHAAKMLSKVIRLVFLGAARPIISAGF